MRAVLLTMAIGVAATSSASASEYRYSYTGNPLTNVDIHGPSTPFTTSDFVSFTFYSPSALGPNEVDQGFAGAITSWSLSLGPLSFSSLDPGSIIYSMNFTTDGSGAPIQWQVTTQTDVVAPNLQPAEYPPTIYEEEVGIYNLPATLGVVDLIYIPSIYQDSYYAYNSGAPGTWNITTVPEAAPWAMLLLGFAGLGFMGLRRGSNDRGGRVTPASS